MTGPTTTGSINAELTIDKSGWDAKAEEVKAEARELGALNPEIKVDANVGPAIAKLNEVAIAEQRLEVATRQAANSASVAYVANERLTAVMEKRGRTDMQVVAASEAAARADRNAEASEIKLLAATEALNAAKAESVRKSLEQASANEIESKSEDKASATAETANHRRVSGLQILIGLAPALLGPTAAIAAAAVGLGVGFGVMGVSGVLAIKGIKDQMEDGTVVGARYAGGLSQLKGNLDALANTSAVHMLQGFDQSLNAIENKMPFLNTLVGNMSGLLGQMGGTALNGVLSGLQQMNTLTSAGAIELSKFVTWLFSFNGTNGFTQFISYAIDNLPATMKLIENLVTLAGHILSAFAPLGPVVLGFLNGLTDVLNALPLPVLAGLVTTALTVAPALQIAGKAVELFGIESNLAVPGIGIFLALLAGVGMAVASSALGTEQGTQAFRDYTQALKDDNEELGKNVRLQAAKALSDAGAFDAGRELGLTQTTLTNALMGNAAAQQIVNDHIKEGRAFQNDWTQGVVDANTGIYVATAAQDKMGKAIDTVTKTLGAQKDSIDRSKQINLDLAAANDTTTGSMTAQTAALQLQANQFGTTATSIKGAQDAQDKNAQSTADATAKMQLQNDAAGLLKMALDGLNGKAISAAQAQNAFDSQLSNMGTHVDKVGKQITFTTANIGDMSAASVALRGQLNSQVSALMQTVEANGGLDESTGKAKAQMEQMRTQIIDNAVAHGVDKDAVTAYVDNLLKIPESVPPTKVDIDKAEAELKLQGFQSAINSLTGKTVTIYAQANIDAAMAALDTLHANSMVAANAYATGAAYRSEGGTVPEYHADGGMAGVNYLAAGGSPFVPRGTDITPAMLTPGEIVMKRASVKSLGAGNLLEANRTGQWPGQGQGQGGGVHVDQITIYDQQDPVATSMDVQRRLSMIAT